MLRIWAVSIGVIALMAYPCSAQVKIDASEVTAGCRQVDVPGTPPFLWSVDPATAAPDALNRVFQADEFNGPEFRSLKGNSSELYFAAIPSSGLEIIGPYSKEKYAFSIHGAGPIREIGAQEWRLAQTLHHFNGTSQPDFSIRDDDNKNVSYKSKEFPKSGEHSSGAILSADARWIAVFSYDGEQLPREQTYAGTIGVPGVTKHPKQGDLYAEIYDVATGLKIVALKGTFTGDIAPNWFLTAFFLEDRYFFLNTGEHTDQIRQFWICELPALPGK